jgi:mRNA interferase RelE/StbE
MFRIKLTARAKKELKNISKQHKELVSLAFEELKENPLTGKPLARELFGRFSYRVGMYRIIYKVDRKNKKITVLTAGHRASVYKSN